jgi:hypothetical protein
MAVSVQLAAEFTSAAAPRTVLQAVTAKNAATNTTAIRLWAIIDPPLNVRNDNESPKRLLVYGRLVAALSVYRILGAIRDRVHVLGCAADRVARGQHQSGTDQDHGRYFLKHNTSSPGVMVGTNAAFPKRLPQLRN